MLGLGRCISILNNPRMLLKLVSANIAPMLLQTFVELAAPTLAAQYPSLLSVVLPNISHPSREIAEVSMWAGHCNS